MEPESALRNWIISDAVLSGLIDERCYPMQLPQTPTLPAVTLMRVSYVRHDEIPFATVRIQATCWGESWSDVHEVAAAIEAAASRRKGDSLGLRIVYANVVNNIDMIDPETGRYTMPVDFKVTYREA
jgi:hypothetical protein